MSMLWYIWIAQNFQTQIPDSEIFIPWQNRRQTFSWAGKGFLEFYLVQKLIPGRFRHEQL